MKRKTTRMIGRRNCLCFVDFSCLILFNHPLQPNYPFALIVIGDTFAPSRKRALFVNAFIVVFNCHRCVVNTSILRCVNFPDKTLPTPFVRMRVWLRIIFINVIRLYRIKHCIFVLIFKRFANNKIQKTQKTQPRTTPSIFDRIHAGKFGLNSVVLEV